MEIHQALYLQSAVKLENLPPPNLPEYAFVGRSNVGKSSLINSLCGIKKLAITSSKPGRTQAINHFIVDKSWYIVDLPGYGYAKVSKKERLKWPKMIKNYVLNRPSLVAVFLLIDIRIPTMESDLEFISLLGKHGIPFCITFTKSDQLKQREIHQKLIDYEETLLKTWESIPTMIVTSAKKGRGKKELLSYIEAGNQVFKPGQVT